MRFRSGKSIIPQVKQASNLIIAILLFSCRTFGDLGRMVMSNLPLTIFIRINKAVSGFNLVASSFPHHGELIHTNILAPIITSCHVTLRDYFMRLELKKIERNWSLIAAQAA